MKSFSLTEIKSDREQKLEKMTDEFTDEWVANQNKSSIENYANSSLFSQLYSEALSTLGHQFDPVIRNQLVYQFFQTESHPQGIWCRTTLSEFQKTNCKWETLLDFNDLPDEKYWKELIKPHLHTCADEHWIYRGVIHGKNLNRVLVAISLGGLKTCIFREFDLETKKFVEAGFALKEGQCRIEQIRWSDNDSLWLGIYLYRKDLENSLPGYYLVHLKRGETLSQSKKMYRVGKYFKIAAANSTHLILDKYLSKNDHEFILLEIKTTSSLRLSIPADAVIESFFHSQIIIKLASEWKIDQDTYYKAGSIVSLTINNNKEVKTKLIFEPSSSCTVTKIRIIKNIILISALNQVNGEVYQVEYLSDSWVAKRLPLPSLGVVKIIADQFVAYENFITPNTLYRCDYEKNTVELFKHSLPDYSVEDIAMDQYTAISLDGTRIPYFIAYPKNMIWDGSNPALLYGYGGFANAVLPNYSGVIGKLWLEKGGVYVTANIRGGAEFGVHWHHDAIVENRHKSFEDFNAVALDLITRNITSPKHLGVYGVSNGGLLAGVTLTKYPDLINAVIAESPLMDMLNYKKLSLVKEHGLWQQEYGDPEDEKMREYIKQYSPFENVNPHKTYPPAFFFSAKNDEVVHPAHSRKMVDKMQLMGHKVSYYENTEGGHSCASNLTQAAYKKALMFSFLIRHLMDNNKVLAISKFAILGEILADMIGRESGLLVKGYLSPS